MKILPWQFLRVTTVLKPGMDGLHKSKPVMKLLNTEEVIEILVSLF